jgi:hypothetical protein
VVSLAHQRSNPMFNTLVAHLSNNIPRAMKLGVILHSSPSNISNMTRNIKDSDTK